MLGKEGEKRGKREYQDLRYTPEGVRFINGETFKDIGFNPNRLQSIPLSNPVTPSVASTEEHPSLLDDDPIVEFKSPKLRKTGLDYEAINRRTDAFLAQLNDPTNNSILEVVLKVAKRVRGEEV